MVSMMEKKPRLVLSLPPFNQFGLGAFIEKSQIAYIPLEQAILDVIQAATKSLIISSPFLDIGRIPAIRDAIIKKAYYGVEVRILVRETFREDDEGRLQSIREFLKIANDSKCANNIHIRDYHYTDDPYVKSSTHAKFVIADENYIYLGSGELRKNSIERNFEAGVLEEGEIAKDLSKIFDNIFENSKEVK